MLVYTLYYDCYDIDMPRQFDSAAEIAEYWAQTMWRQPYIMTKPSKMWNFGVNSKYPMLVKVQVYIVCRNFFFTKTILLRVIFFFLAISLIV